MQLSQLMYFVTVAEQGSINKAAEKLFVTQPNLSKAIGNLESELKVRIFDRTNKGVILTEDGKKLYEYARTILNQMELISGLSAKERLRILSIASGCGGGDALFAWDRGSLRCGFLAAHRSLQDIQRAISDGIAAVSCAVAAECIAQHIL